MPMNVRASGNVHARSTGRTRSSVRTSGVCPYRDPPDGRTYGPANPPMARIARPYVHARQLPPSRCASARARSRSRSRDPRGPVARDHPVTPSSSSTRCSGTATESGSCDHPVTSASGTVAAYGIAGRDMTGGYVRDRCDVRDRARFHSLPGRARRSCGTPRRRVRPGFVALGLRSWRGEPAGRVGAGSLATRVEHRLGHCRSGCRGRSSALLHARRLGLGCCGVVPRRLSAVLAAPARVEACHSFGGGVDAPRPCPVTRGPREERR
jgi:hypothetical protein